jgi:hypothetical protein
MIQVNVDNYRTGESWDFSNHNFTGLVEAFFEKYEFVGEGRNRVVFSRNDAFVLKVPKNLDGLADNWHERNWRHENYCLARLYKNVILVMQKVNRKINMTNLPLWTHYIDGVQVGKTRDGKLKAYDFGIK